jgi:hypothetical protein
MSLLDQAKREAIRLLKLAKKQNPDAKIPFLTIKNLSQAREHLAFLNGFDSWHAYERKLSDNWSPYDQKLSFREQGIPGQHEKVSLSDKKLAIMQEDFFISDRPYTPFKSIRNIFEQISTVKSDAVNVDLGTAMHSGNNSMLRILPRNKGKQWHLTDRSFPLMMTGSAGSGKSSVIVSLMDSMMQTMPNFSCIYMTPNGGNDLYMKLHASCWNRNRLDDLYCLNLYRPGFSGAGETHTFDPINPLVGNISALQVLFGEKLASMLNAIFTDVHESGCLITSDHIGVFLNLKNLIRFRQDKRFSGSHDFVESYLLDIGMDTSDVEFNEDKHSKILKRHALNCTQALDFIHMLLAYNHCFSIDPDVSFEKAYAGGKILLVNHESLEKSGGALTTISILAMLHLAQAKAKYERDPSIKPLLILDEYCYLIGDIEKHTVFGGWYDDGLRRGFRGNENIIFSGNSIQGYDYANRMRNGKFDYIVKNTNTFVIMKTEDLSLTDAFKSQAFDHGVSAHSISPRMLSSQGPGSALVFGSGSNTENKLNSGFGKNDGYAMIKCTYKNIQYPESISLNQQKM